MCLGGHGPAKSVAVVGTVSEQDLTGPQTLQHVVGAPAVVGLSLGSA